MNTFRILEADLRFLISFEGAFRLAVENDGLEVRSVSTESVIIGGKHSFGLGVFVGLPETEVEETLLAIEYTAGVSTLQKIVDEPLDDR